MLPVLGGGWVWIRDGRQRPPGSRTLDLAVRCGLYSDCWWILFLSRDRSGHGSGSDVEKRGASCPTFFHLYLFVETSDTGYINIYYISRVL